MSEHLRRERHDLHESFGAQLARHRPENAGADRLQLGTEQHRGVGVEFDLGPVVTPDAMAGAHDDGVVDLTLLNPAARRGILDADLDYVTDVRIPALAPAEHLNAHYLPGAGVVGDLQHGLHLDHCNSPT